VAQSTRNRNRAFFPLTTHTAHARVGQGFGNTIDFDLDRVIPDKSKSLADGAIEPWTKPRYRQLAIEMRKFARTKLIPVDVAFRDLTPAQRNAIVDGTKTRATKA